MKNTNKKMSGVEKVAIGAGVAALGAASAGAYYLFGPKAKAHQKKAEMLMAKMKKEVLSEAKKAKSATMPVYHKAVDVVSSNYAKQYKENGKEIKAFAKKLKSEWKGADKLVKKTVKDLKKKTK